MLLPSITRMNTNSDSTALNKPLLQTAIWGTLIVVLVAVVGVGIWSLFHGKTAGGTVAQLQVYGTVPDFQLIERSRKPVSRADFAGTIWIADFIFTRCPGVCPLLSVRMAALQDKLQQTRETPVKLVSFSVDPEWDSPEELQRYAQRYNADPEQWLFLTGELPNMYTLISEGFRLSVARLSPEDQKKADMPIVHSDRFVLIDQQFRIRGYYRGTEEAALAQLLKDIETLRQE